MNSLHINELNNTINKTNVNNVNKLTKKKYNSRRENKINLILSMYKHNDYIINYIIIFWILFICIILFINIYFT